MLVGARVVQGAFAAMMVPQALSTVQALFSPRERAPIYGVIGGVSAYNGSPDGVSKGNLYSYSDN